MLSLFDLHFLTLGQGDEPMSHLRLQLARKNYREHLHNGTGDT